MGGLQLLGTASNNSTAVSLSLQHLSQPVQLSLADWTGVALCIAEDGMSLRRMAELLPPLENDTEVAAPLVARKVWVSSSYIAAQPICGGWDESDCTQLLCLPAGRAVLPYMAPACLYHLAVVVAGAMAVFWLLAGQLPTCVFRCAFTGCGLCAARCQPPCNVG